MFFSFLSLLCVSARQLELPGTQPEVVVSEENLKGYVTKAWVVDCGELNKCLFTSGGEPMMDQRNDVPKIA